MRLKERFNKEIIKTGKERITIDSGNPEIGELGKYYFHQMGDALGGCVSCNNREFDFPLHTAKDLVFYIWSKYSIDECKERFIGFDKVRFIDYEHSNKKSEKNRPYKFKFSRNEINDVYKEILNVDYENEIKPLVIKVKESKYTNTKNINIKSR